MAPPKKPNPMEDPPTASSTDEEEDVIEQEADQDSSPEDKESGSDEESEDDEPPPPKKPTSAQPKKPQTGGSSTPSVSKPQRSDSDSDSESESDSGSSTDSDAEPAKSSTPVKPIATKPMKEKEKATVTVAAVAKSTPSTAKKAGEDNKKAKKGGGGSDHEEEPKTEDTKKLSFQRLFSEEDEIELLKGLGDYAAKKGVDPFSDIDGFYEYVKGWLQCDANKLQVHDKIKRLRKKYNNNVTKGEKKGEEINFSKAHEHKSFNLSKKIWGQGAVEASGSKKRKAPPTPKANGKVQKLEFIETKSGVEKTQVVDGIKIDSFDVFHNDGSFQASIIRRGLELVDASKRAEVEERWRKLQIAQLELFIDQSKLALEQAKVVLDAAKSSNR